MTTSLKSPSDRIGASFRQDMRHILPLTSLAADALAMSATAL
jgi:hypothetical protein